MFCFGNAGFFLSHDFFAEFGRRTVQIDFLVDFRRDPIRRLLAVLTWSLKSGRGAGGEGSA